jgi:hypothetical protein
MGTLSSRGCSRKILRQVGNALPRQGSYGIHIHALQTTHPAPMGCPCDGHYP